MAQDLEDKVKQLEKEVFQLRQVIDSLDAHIYWKDIEGRVLGMNKANMQAMCIDNIKNAGSFQFLVGIEVNVYKG